MVTIKGVLEGGLAYEVEVTGDPAEPVRGSKAVAAVVDLAIAGKRRVLAGPTGPLVTVSARHPKSIALLLAQEGTVASATGIDTTAAAPRAGVIT